MNSFVAICACLAVVVSAGSRLPGEGNYVWDVVIQQGPSTGRAPWSVMGSLFMHAKTGGWRPQTYLVPLDGFFNALEGAGVTPGWMLSANRKWTESFKIDIDVSKIQSAQFEWRRSPQDYDKTPQDESIKQVTITDRKTQKTVSFCYDGAAVPSGTVVDAHKC